MALTEYITANATKSRESMLKSMRCDNSNCRVRMLACKIASYNSYINEAKNLIASQPNFLVPVLYDNA